MTYISNNGIFTITTLVILVIILLTMIGCRTKQSVTETVATHDTLIIHHTDTLRDIRAVTLRDTIYRELQTVIFKDTAGNILHTHVTNNYYRGHAMTQEHDKESKERDTIYIVSDDAREKVTVKTKYILRWWKWAVLAALALSLVMVIVKRRK